MNLLWRPIIRFFACLASNFLNTQALIFLSVPLAYRAVHFFVSA